MKVELMLSKNQMRAVAGLAQDPDKQRGNRIFLDLMAGRSVDTVMCPGCSEEFTRQATDRGECCSAECQKKRAVAAVQQGMTTGSWQPQNHLSR